MEIILRYVTYSIFTGDASVMEDRCLNGLRETYLALGTPGNSVAAGVNLMKEAAISIANDKSGITQGDCTALMSCLLYTSPSPRDVEESRMPSSA